MITGKRDQLNRKEKLADVVVAAAAATVSMKKKALRETQILHAGCSKVQTPPARPLSQTHRQDRLQYTAPQLASVQFNYISFTHTKKWTGELMCPDNFASSYVSEIKWKQLDQLISNFYTAC